MREIIAIIYLIAAWWSISVLSENFVFFTTLEDYFFKKLIYGMLFGFITIPIAIIKRLIQHYAK
ncbi:MAG: cystinosin-like protein [Oscillospiraceae bacterium]